MPGQKVKSSPIIEIPIGPWKLRPWQPGDEAALVKYGNNRAIWRNLGDRFPHPYTAKDAEDWVKSSSNCSPATFLAIATPDEAIGNIGLRPQDDVHFRSAELGYWLAEPFWGQGIATRSVRAFSEYAFDNFDIIRLFAIVFDWNPASARVLEKAGFTLEARMRKSATKDGHTVDELLYALVRE